MNSQAKKFKILIISNGKGEDKLAATFLKNFRELAPASIDLQITAFPLVGPGKAYAQLDIPTPHSWPELPSGGFLSSRLFSLLKDIFSGLLWQSLRQIIILKKIMPNYQAVVCVGDFAPLFFIARTKHPACYHINTAYSWYLRPLFKLESQLLKKQVQLTFVRDQYTAEQMQKLNITADFKGSIMLDDENLKQQGSPAWLPAQKAVLLVPSSRIDAYQNVKKLIKLASLINYPHFILSISPALNIDHMLVTIAKLTKEKISEINKDGLLAQLKINNKTIYIATNTFGDLAPQALAVLGLTGTGCEQLCALGVPLFLVQGRGAHNNKRRMEHYQKLLGACCAILPGPPLEQAFIFSKHLKDLSRLKQMSAEGPKRFGSPGASKRIAEKIWLAERDVPLSAGQGETLSLRIFNKN